MTREITGEHSYLSFRENDLGGLNIDYIKGNTINATSRDKFCSILREKTMWHFRQISGLFSERAAFQLWAADTNLINFALLILPKTQLSWKL